VSSGAKRSSPAQEEPHRKQNTSDKDLDEEIKRSLKRSKEIEEKIKSQRKALD
jgi:hypothetical protein